MHILFNFQNIEQKTQNTKNCIEYAELPYPKSNTLTTPIHLLQNSHHNFQKLNTLFSILKIEHSMLWLKTIIT